MMSLTFGLFTQVSGSGPFGPLVLFYFVAFILFYVILFLMENLVSKNVGLDQKPHYVASDLGLHCLPMILFMPSLRVDLNLEGMQNGK